MQLIYIVALLAPTVFAAEQVTEDNPPGFGTVLDQQV